MRSVEETKTAGTLMTVKIVAPEGILLDTEAIQLDVCTSEGWWTFLPRHMDVVHQVNPSVARVTDMKGKILFVAITDGLLVKRTKELTLAVRQGILITEGEDVTEELRIHFEKIEKDEQQQKKTIAQLESDFLHLFVGR